MKVSQNSNEDLNTETLEKINNRKAEMHQLYKDFKIALKHFQKLSVTEGLEEEEEVNDNFTLNSVLTEINALTKETEEIRAILSRPQYSSNLRVHNILQQLNTLEKYISNLSLRASALC